MVIKLSILPPGNGVRYDGKIALDASPTLIHWIRELPGALYCKKADTWTVPRAWPSAVALTGLSDQTHEKLVPNKDLADWVRTEKVAWGELAERSAKVLGEARDGLFPHQDADVAWLTYEGGPLGRLLLNEQGVGKTASVLTAVKEKGLTPALVVCPKVVARSGWLLELERVAPELRVGIALGSAPERVKVFEAAARGELDVVVTGYEVMKAHTRFTFYGGAEPLKRCRDCGGPVVAATRADRYVVKIPNGFVDAWDAGEIPSDSLAVVYQVSWALQKGRRLKKWTAVTVGNWLYNQLGGYGYVLSSDLTAALEQALVEAEETLLAKLVAAQKAACQAHEKELNRVDWAVIVLDEAHRILTASTQTRMAVAGLVNSAPRARRWALTGTPVSKRADGLWSLLNYVDPYAWPVKSTWVDRYCIKDYNSAGYLEIGGYRPEREKELHRSLDPVSRRVLKAQALDLPPLLRGGTLVREVQMGSEQALAYREMRDEMVAQVREGLITAQNAPVQTGRLSLLASATGYPGAPGSGEVLLRMPSCKIEEIANGIRMEEYGGQYAMAFSSRKMLRLTVEELVRRGVLAREQIGIVDGLAKDHERARDIANFTSGQLPCLAFTYAAGGTGLTLTAAETLVLVERHWSPILMSQGLGRVHRAGMPDRPVAVVDIITAGTVEMRQLERLGEDLDLLEEVVHDKERLAKFLMGDA